MNVYKHQVFVQKLIENKSPILDSSCSQCYKSFLYIDNNSFNLIENKNKEFIVICDNCLNSNVDNKLDNLVENRIIKFEDLLEHKPSIYEKNNININIIENSNNDNNINDNAQQPNNNDGNDNNNNNEEYNKEINELLYLLKGYEDNINVLETKINDIPFSLEDDYEKKLDFLKQDFLIKKMIQNYYNEFNNFVTIINMLSSLNTIINLTSLKLYNYKNSIKIKSKEQYLIVNQFINCNEFNKRVDIPEIKKYYQHSKMTKTYLNENQFLEDKNHAVEEILNTSFSNVLNVNFVTGETFKYNITTDNCFCEKITPISYCYNMKYNSSNYFNYQEVILYNLRQDKKIYYAIYNVKCQMIEKDNCL
jgi:hypothetical protein